MPMDSVVFESVIDVRLEQSSNALSPMVTTELPIFTVTVPYGDHGIAHIHGLQRFAIHESLVAYGLYRIRDCNGSKGCARIE